ncbi:MAG: sulfatase-like hydrolase/transferase [Candidatus Aminicenantes bacterium]|nr:sulfatase-like hydrolase/transferase [Candidatus Aminicenantes bacterium]NIM78029.1 sulfatase-like hydrolase/transferase [Candidatus Aminicenantes bacterium]NIN17349.1 sulfatase-like hydrolase/transferase [Candidatus Aminicenantes bacterium]NIN41242.1 sulfatase-like hydrolase/transferase [Candidatus Aminicenantes bacterium]NIN84015.1 sulfatase-like hydrolase/transferase [Candidatus Aminicenantes bacterium]
MIKKKLLLSAAAVSLIIVIALLLFFSLKRHETANLNLMSVPKVFVYPENAEAQFNRLVEENGLEDMFIKERGNIYYPREKWSGRIKYSGVSYQGLFAVRDSAVIFKLKKLDAAALSFSLFNPQNSRLFYLVTVKTGNKKINLYKGFFDKEVLFSKTVDLKSQFDREVELIFETKGKGVGAWINPRLVKPKKHPRVIVVIVLDTLRYDHTSLYGYSRATTPVLERLSQEAVVFRNAYTTTSWTLPAHVSLFSGKNLDEHGVVTPNDRISTEYPLIAEIFQREGYVTAAFTGGGFIDDSYGFARGFQVYSNTPGRAFSMNSAERVFNHFKNYINGFRGNDVFVFLHTYQMHAPYKAPRKYIAQISQDVHTNLKGVRNFIREKHEYYKTIDAKDRQLLIDLYDAGILYADRMLVGNVVRFLKGKGLYRDAMIVVLSDHGEEFYDHHSWEHGHTLYKELIKIPLLVKYPQNRKKGEETALASITDIPAIILEESGVPYDEMIFRNEVGQTNRVLPVLLPLSPIIRQFPAKISLVGRNHHFIFNVIDKQMLAFFNPPPPQVRMQEIELYDSSDYLEKVNVYMRRRRIADRFGKHMAKYLQRFKGVKMKTFKGSKELQERLKSLGYLGN